MEFARLQEAAEAPDTRVKHYKEFIVHLDDDSMLRPRLNNHTYEDRSTAHQLFLGINYTIIACFIIILLNTFSQNEGNFSPDICCNIVPCKLLSSRQSTGFL